ncbi:MAG TPA: DUF6134 family protein [Alphaproteobacteria bacterium]|nr:DUF6134 family protein [Alphaproteobacteria bacterium]
MSSGSAAPAAAQRFPCRRRHLVLCAMAALLLCAAAAPARAVDAPDGTLRWGIWRDGRKIGTDVMTLRHRRGDLIVEDEIQAADSFGIIALHRFIHRGREVWRGGRLLELDAFTNDNDKVSNLSAETEARGLVVDGPVGRFVAPPGVCPSTLWSIDMTTAPMLIDVISGNLLAVRFAIGAEQPVATDQGDIAARHVSVSGDLVRELWYGPDGLLLQAHLVWPDGKPVDFRRERP